MTIICGCLANLTSVRVRSTSAIRRQGELLLLSRIDRRAGEGSHAAMELLGSKALTNDSDEIEVAAEGRAAKIGRWTVLLHLE